jgi:predicted signal transduction protein with EAL and GGDEF domain
MPDNIDVVLKRADMALYAAKARGRDRTVLDDGDSADGSLSGLEIGQYSQHAPMVA